MFPRYHTLTYHKGSFGHILLKYQLYDLLLVCTQICIHLPCYWMVKFIFHFRESLSYLWQVFSGNIVNLFVCPKEDSKHTPNTLLSSIKSTKKEKKAENQTKELSLVCVLFEEFSKKIFIQQYHCNIHVDKYYVFCHIITTFLRYLSVYVSK